MRFWIPWIDGTKDCAQYSLRYFMKSLLSLAGFAVDFLTACIGLLFVPVCGLLRIGKSLINLQGDAKDYESLMKTISDNSRNPQYMNIIKTRAKIFPRAKVYRDLIDAANKARGKWLAEFDDDSN